MTEYATIDDVNNYVIVETRIKQALKYLELASEEIGCALGSKYVIQNGWNLDRKMLDDMAKAKESIDDAFNLVNRFDAEIKRDLNRNHPIRTEEG